MPAGPARSSQVLLSIFFAYFSFRFLHLMSVWVKKPSVMWIVIARDRGSHLNVDGLRCCETFNSTFSMKCSNLRGGLGPRIRSPETYLASEFCCDSPRAPHARSVPSSADIRL
jgi:hypothetical protein